ncbi:MauE/DoxX family redox-associated membrane protein [Corynebacterium sp. Q4381]|uniref:MauE/DoxX family redox-associated membrane protein n=1 Tax=Corynebacterium sp. Marseille-Q4381 TaxID=3121597 RepID=UPI002FE59D05
MTRVLDFAAAAARFGLAAVWIYAGYTKIGNHLEVFQKIEAYEVFTPYWSDILANFIGPLELAGGLLLLLGIKIRWAGGVSMVVLIMFIMGLWSVHARGMVIDCGCFDPNQREPQHGDIMQAIWRDVFLLAVTAFMMYRPFKKFAVYP